jgi:hypothetical protein
LALKKLSPLSLETGGRNPAKLEACTLDGFLLQPDRNPRMQHLMMQEQESPNNRQFCQGVPRNTNKNYNSQNQYRSGLVDLLYRHS